MTDERRENAKRIRSGLRQGLPFDLIFPRKAKVTPAPDVYADGHLDFVATTLPSPHGGTLMRSYLIDCRHSRSETTVAVADGVDASDREALDRMDGDVLGNMLPTFQRRTGCHCWPKGWARVEAPVQ